MGVEAPKNIDYVRNTVVKRAKNFPREFLQGVQLRVTDERTITLANDLQEGRFWRVLYALDGRNDPAFSDSLEIKEKRRDWARKMFRPQEVERLVQTCVDMAVTAPLKTGWPGTYHGHSVLYGALVRENPESLFEGMASDQLKERIINGTFWELIPELTPSLGDDSMEKMKEILQNHNDKLNIQFATEGYSLFKRNNGENCPPPLIYMKEKNLNRYTGFIRSVDHEHEALGISSEQMRYLTDPIKALGTRSQRKEEREMRELATLPF